MFNVLNNFWAKGGNATVSSFHPLDYAPVRRKKRNSCVTRRLRFFAFKSLSNFSIDGERF